LSATGSSTTSSWAKPPPRQTQRSKDAGTEPPLGPTTRKKTLSATEQGRSEAASQTRQRISAIQELRSEVAARNQTLESLQESESVSGRNSPARPSSPQAEIPAISVVSVTNLAPVIVPTITTKPKMSSTKAFRQPNPWDAKASPTFDGKTAESLMKYIRYCKMIIEGTNVTGDDEKKELMKQYASRTTNEEWESLDSYKLGTFDEWVAEIEGLFPEIRTIQTGSLAKLSEICAEYRNLNKGEEGRIKRFNLSFKNEAQKLEKPPSLVTNLTLVDKFLGCFEKQFLIEINMMISQTMYWKRYGGTNGPLVPTPTVSGVDRPEETIPLEELMTMVEKLA
jgi:hypothetical protein